MKQFEFKTDKGNFLLIDEDSEGKVRDPQGVEYLEIGRLRTITEEQAREVMGHTYSILDFNNGKPKYVTKTESLHSFLRSKGIFLFENPFNIENCFEINYYIKRLESVHKVFYNPILFKINVGSSKNNS